LERADWNRIGPCGRPPKRERIFLETRAILFGSLTNYINADLSFVSSEKSALLLADLALDAQAHHEGLERNCAALRAIDSISPPTEEREGRFS
jgi:hypothetical protein